MQDQPPCSSRIDLRGLKAEIVKNLGPDRSNQYLYCLNSLLSLKMSKAEFDRICLQILGRQNIPLHNRLLLSILKNANHADAPPLRHVKRVPDNAYEDSVRANKDKEQTTINHFSLPSTFGNGNAEPVLQHRQVFSQKNHSHGCEKDSNKTVMVEDDGEMPSSILRLDAPLGISLRRVTRRVTSLGTSGDRFSSSDFGGLFDSETLRCRMDRIALSEGLGGVSLDCADLLNNALDSYLKRVITSSLELGRETLSSRNVFIRNGTLKNHHHDDANILSGFSSGRMLNSMLHEQRPIHTVSLPDLKVTMELNPQQLGDEWPVKLEKILLYLSDSHGR